MDKFNSRDVDRMKINLNEEEKKSIIEDINFKIGGDINNLNSANELIVKLNQRKRLLLGNLNEADNEITSKLSLTVCKAEENIKDIEKLKLKSEEHNVKTQKFLDKVSSLQNELERRFATINKLESVRNYLETFEKIDDISNRLQKSGEDKESVSLYGELNAMCKDYKSGHRGVYIRECTHYWHGILRDKFAKQYEDLMKLLKWPFTSEANSPPPQDVLVKFVNITRYLFLIEEPKETVTTSLSGDYFQELNPCLPIKLLLKPLKKRFLFHFTGSRQTARIDRPEWFLTQTLTWIKLHHSFILSNVQPVAEELQLHDIDTIDEFNEGLIALAAERLHTILTLYCTQGLEQKNVNLEAAFAHAVDEALGFHKELTALTGKEGNSVLSVLTKAETFVKWLAIEKKYESI